MRFTLITGLSFKALKLLAVRFALSLILTFFLDGRGTVRAFEINQSKTILILNTAILKRWILGWKNATFEYKKRKNYFTFFNVLPSPFFGMITKSKKTYE